MSWRATLLQTLGSTAIWGVLMTMAFDWPRENIMLPMAVFGLVMFALLALMKVIRDRRSDR